MFWSEVREKGITEKFSALEQLDDIENVDQILNSEEIKIINTVFNDIDNFKQIIDSLEYALNNRILVESDFKILYASIVKMVKSRAEKKGAEERKEKRSLAKTFFELPELISKKFFTSSNNF